MGGGLMQLVAYGAQDIYLTGNPQITFFKVVYRRHTNFSIESVPCTFNSTFDFGKKTTVTISRNGDLISNMYLEIKVPALKQAQPTGAGTINTFVQWTNGLGNALIKSVAIEIGGQEIDKHYGEWMDIWNELNVGVNHRDGYDFMVNNKDSGSTPNATNKITLYVPLRFWFNRNPGLALPLISLQYHEVKINVEIENITKLIKTDVVDLTTVEDASSTASSGSGLSEASITSASLYVDYIYLDTDERRRFAQVSHEYLIEQVQYTGPESIEANGSNEKFNLNFNHPVKSLHWVIQDDAYLNGSMVVSSPLVDGKNVKGGQKLVYYVAQSTDGKNDTFEKGKIMINGHDRMPERDSDYFRLVQNVQHMDVFPRKTIYTYSFALRPSEHQPSGTCNFSRLDNASLHLNFNTNQKANDRFIKIFAVNYNVLRIMSGMGGLAYSN